VSAAPLAKGHRHCIAAERTSVYLWPQENFRSKNPSHLQRNIQTPGESGDKIHLQTNRLDLLSGLPVVNRSGETRSTENGTFGLGPVGTQQPHSITFENNEIFRPGGQAENGLLWEVGWGTWIPRIPRETLVF
jgi:hypothetical protein